MTDLTQDWKDGKLLKGLYYVQFHNGEVKICGFYELCVFRFSVDTNEIKILAEVPDYIAWQNMWNTADMEHKANNKLLEDVERLEKENKELKRVVESQKQTNLALIKRLEEKVTNVKEALDFLQAESSELSI